jgi:wyosine [tRNA(Phe)-imidazoG37] synthetase (radical SAM superfamily)
MADGNDRMADETQQLTTTDHDRDAAHLRYVYPVVSRRAGGVSVGINLNTNNACNWHCVYCQVPNLKRGVAPAIDLELLEQELRGFLGEILHGDFMQQRVPEGCRTLHDIAISGNGEPTSSRQFDAVVELICRVMADFELTDKIKLVLITNGSYLHRPEVRRGLEIMATEADGEVWFKVDSATCEGIRRINGVSLSPERLRQQLELSAALCPTWIQSCMFAWDGEPPSDGETGAYLDFIAALVRDQIPVKGVLLYGVARPPMQEEASHISVLDGDWMRAFAARIEGAGLPVRLSL